MRGLFLDAAEVAQVYLTDLQASCPVPLQKLVSFKRVFLKAGQSKRIKFTLPGEAMLFVNEQGESVMEPGQFRLTVGSCSPGKRGIELGAPASLTALFAVR